MILSMVWSVELAAAEVTMIFHKRTGNLVTFLLFNIVSPLKSKKRKPRERQSSKSFT